MTVPSCGATAAVGVSAVVGTDRSVDCANPAQRGVGHRDRRVGDRHGRLLHPAEQRHGRRHARDEQLCAVPDAIDRAAGNIVRLHLRGVPRGNRRRPWHQSTIWVHADRPADAARRPHVGQRVPVRRRFDDRADLWLRHRIPVPPWPGLHRRLLPAGAADRGGAVIARRPDRHPFDRIRRPPRRC